MSFWSSEILRDHAKSGALISPYQDDRVKYGAYELSMGPEAFITDNKSGKKQYLQSDEQLVIPPGQFALLLTQEEIRIPNNVIAFISIKAGIKFMGLVNVSGFHVDPGFGGRLKFSVYNAGSKNIVIAQGKPVFLIWFSELAQPTLDIYKGSHNDQREITADDVMRMQGEVVSPVALKAEIDKLNRHFQFFASVATAVVAALIAGVVTLSFRYEWSALTGAGGIRPAVATGTETTVTPKLIRNDLAAKTRKLTDQQVGERH